MVWQHFTHWLKWLSWSPYSVDILKVTMTHGRLLTYQFKLSVVNSCHLLSHSTLAGPQLKLFVRKLHYCQFAKMLFEKTMYFWWDQSDSPSVTDCAFSERSCVLGVLHGHRAGKGFSVLGDEALAAPWGTPWFPFWDKHQTDLSWDTDSMIATVFQS